MAALNDIRTVGDRLEMVNPENTKMAMSLCRQSLRVLSWSALCLVMAGTALFYAWPTIYAAIMRWEMQLSPNSRAYKLWKGTPVPIYIEFYFHNWTNPQELGKANPKFTEMGPYRFNEVHKKVNVTWNNENGTVTFELMRWWYFDREKSAGDLTDLVTTLNAVALTAALTVRDWSYFYAKSLSIGMTATKQQIAITKPVGELLFDGYSDTLIDLGRKASFTGVAIPFDKFGWFYGRNGTSDMEGVFNMDTGANGLDTIGTLWNWNYDNITQFYEGSCGEIRGSAGELFPPGQSRDKPVTMYSPDLCRSLSFTYEEDVTVQGIQGYKYVGGPDLVDNGTMDEANECFCSGECVPSGVINVTACRYGAPAFASYPHFYLADSAYTDEVDGMSPVKHRHQFYMVLEPTTGIPLDVAARFQINILLQPVTSVKLFQNVPRVFFPMLWFNHRATMTEELAYELRIFKQLPNIVCYASFCMVSLGLILLCYVAIVCYVERKRTKSLQGASCKERLEELYKETTVPLITMDKVIIKNSTHI